MSNKTPRKKHDKEEPLADDTVEEGGISHKGAFFFYIV